MRQGIEKPPPCEICGAEAVERLTRTACPGCGSRVWVMEHQGHWGREVFDCPCPRFLTRQQRERRNKRKRVWQAVKKIREGRTRSWAARVRKQVAGGKAKVSDFELPEGKRAGEGKGKKK